MPLAPLTSALNAYFAHIQTSHPGTFPAEAAITDSSTPLPNTYDRYLNLYLPLRHDALQRSSKFTRWINLDIFPQLILTFTELPLALLFLARSVFHGFGLASNPGLFDKFGAQAMAFISVVSFFIAILYLILWLHDMTELRTYWGSLKKNWESLKRTELLGWESRALDVGWGDRKGERRFWLRLGLIKFFDWWRAISTAWTLGRFVWMLVVAIIIVRQPERVILWEPMEEKIVRLFLR